MTSTPTLPAGGNTADRPIDRPCPLCGATTLTVFFEEGHVPTNSCLLLDDPAEAADFPRGELVIAFCDTCGFVTNTAFVPGQAEYSQRYEETQGFSPRFMAFATELAERWVSDYGLADKTVLEIGCGKGEFLIEMAKAGAGHCIGIDPGVHPERIDDPEAADIEWIADFYDERYTHIDADVVICRHTLEHIPDVAEFMTTIRDSIGDRPDTVVLFELPDVRRVLEEVAFWDMYYEHCSYFSLGSLARLFRQTGFEVVELSMEYDDQYLLIAARPSTVPAAGEPLPEEDDLDRLREGVAAFRRGYDELVGGWRERIADLSAAGGRAVIWGSGSKGVSFISNLALGDELAAAVDINPHKWGKFMVGSNHEIVSPDALTGIEPDLVVAMNPIYVDEIGSQLDELGVETELTAL
ncbi:MAG: methyltransferase domain-containing protein [Ilumatobacter sp.]|uniref:class I SAM-dependent methyltransferase n=1 Tax=Ilumatobacter sp. TaxID=1967498 RepID=UPI0026349299|nr:class I SAM-dependent methyltransferase [Ilumatobacter sp.]MDJ0768703.1 methyltransferase domain-containing protein [Ilumatobacter sp.]